MAAQDANFARIDTRFTKIEGEMLLIKWMVAFNLSGMVAVLFLLLRHSGGPK